METAEKLREQELGYLRDELNQRVNFSGEHTHKVFHYIILLWVGTLALFGTKGDIENTSVFFIVATMCFFSVVILYFLSRMDLESINSISEIAAYITIFYEKHPKHKEKEGKIFWELSRFEMENKQKKPDWNYNKLNEYFWFSIISICIIFAIIIAICIENFHLSNFLNRNSEICLSINNSSPLVMILLCLIYTIISIILSVKIFKISSSVSTWYDIIKKKYLKSFLNYAIETNYYTPDEAKERLGEYIYNEIK